VYGCAWRRRKGGEGGRKEGEKEGRVHPLESLTQDPQPFFVMSSSRW